MKHLPLLCVLLMAQSLFAQHEWVLQPWMQVAGSYNGQQLGKSVSYLGKKNDSTLIGVGDGSGTIYVYQVKSPADTIPKYTIKGNSCLLGDFNGDGIKDLAVSGNPTKIYLGKSAGVFDTIPFFVKYQEKNGSAFGAYIAIGKITDHIFDDILITDVGYPNGDTQCKVYLFKGGVSMHTIPFSTFTGDTIFSGFGLGIASGDLNNDGFDDIIVRGYDQTNSSNGQRFCYIKIYCGGDTIHSTYWKYLKGTNVVFGGLSCFDVNGYGIDDLLWSNTDSLNSVVYVNYGKPVIDSMPNLRLKDPGTGGLDVIENGGDVNGDGYNDIVIGAPGYGQELGTVLIFSGGPKIDANYDAAASLSVQSQFGRSIASIGDVDGDGCADILVGAPRYQWDEYRGKWFIMLGSKRIPVSSVVGQRPTTPSNFNLSQNYPNPFNPTTTIGYELSITSYIALKIFDVLGREVAVLVNKEQEAGKHTVAFDAGQLSGGIYFYRLTAVNKQGKVQTEAKRMTLLK